jgi:uncharacterized coiled-coil protein SlyX/predicted RNA-binding Zn-ribbon protein involved in translation (DUF1610 family)
LNSRERIAYLRGLLDSMPRDEKESKIYFGLIEALDALASELAEQTKLIDLQREDYEGLADEMDDLQDAVYELEEAIGVDSGLDRDDDDDDDDDNLEGLTDSYISMTCPSCAYSFYYRYEEGREGEKLICPSCGEEFSRSE